MRHARSARPRERQCGPPAWWPWPLGLLAAALVVAWLGLAPLAVALGAVAVAAVLRPLMEQRVALARGTWRVARQQREAAAEALARLRAAAPDAAERDRVVRNLRAQLAGPLELATARRAWTDVLLLEGPQSDAWLGLARCCLFGGEVETAVRLAAEAVRVGALPAAALRDLAEVARPDAGLPRDASLAGLVLAVTDPQPAADALAGLDRRLAAGDLPAVPAAVIRRLAFERLADPEGLARTAEGLRGAPVVDAAILELWPGEWPVGDEADLLLADAEALAAAGEAVPEGSVTAPDRLDDWRVRRLHHALEDRLRAAAARAAPVGDLARAVDLLAEVRRLRARDRWLSDYQNAALQYLEGPEVSVADGA